MSVCDRIVRVWQVLAFVGAFGGASLGCAVDASAPDVATSEQALRSSFDGTVVDGVRAPDGAVRSTVLGPDGQVVVVLDVRGDRLVVERRDRTSSPLSFGVPADAQGNGLEDWNLVAYGFSRGTSTPSDPSSVRLSRMSEGTDGQKCIAAGGTWAECTMWLYCRTHWCPFW